MESNITPGKRLKMARIALGITQENLAKELGLKWYQIKDLEADKTKLSAELAMKLQKKFDISTEWILTGEGTMFVNEGISQVFSGNHNTNVNQSVGSFVIQQANKEDLEETDEEIKIILNKLKELLKKEELIKKIVLNFIEGNYTPKLLNDFLNKLNKLKEL